MVLCNADGTENRKASIVFIGKAEKQRAFKKKALSYYGFAYSSNTRVWMKAELFFE